MRDVAFIEREQGNLFRRGHEVTGAVEPDPAGNQVFVVQFRQDPFQRFLVVQRVSGVQEKAILAFRQRSADVHFLVNRLHRDADTFFKPVLELVQDVDAAVGGTAVHDDVLHLGARGLIQDAFDGRPEPRRIVPVDGDDGKLLHQIMIFTGRKPSA